MPRHRNYSDRSLERKALLEDFSDDESERKAMKVREVLAKQKEFLKKQDSGLDILDTGLNNLLGLSRSLDLEMDYQKQVIEKLDVEVEQSTSLMERVSNRARTILRWSKKGICGYCKCLTYDCCCGHWFSLLLLSLILLCILFKLQNILDNY